MEKKNWLENAKEIEIVSGEGEQGTVEEYDGARTERAICKKLKEEECDGDRWAYALIDGARYDRDGNTLTPRN